MEILTKLLGGNTAVNSTMVKTMDNVPVPFFAEVKDGIPRGGTVEIEGQVTQDADQAIWFEYRAMDGITLHLNIRMGHNKEHITVVNSFERRKWQREQRHSNSCSPGGPINMSITNNWSSWEIQVNGQKFTFPHRLSAKDISRMEIRGSIRINRLSFKNLDGHIQAYNQQSQNIPQPNFTPPPYNPMDSTDYSGGTGAPVGQGQPIYNTSPQPGIGPGSGPGVGPGNSGFGQPNPNQPGYGMPTSGGFYPNLGQDLNHSQTYGQPQQNNPDPRGYY
jgi:hypothetical protein